MSAAHRLTTSCDVLFAVLANHRQLPAGLSYPDYMRSIREIIMTANRPAFILAPRNARRYMPVSPSVIDRRGEPAWLYTVNAIPVSASGTMDDLLYTLSQRFKCLGEFSFHDEYGRPYFERMRKGYVYVKAED